MFFSLDTLGPAQEPWLLYERDPAGRPRARDVYRRFVCRRCGRMNELAALATGVPVDFRPAPGGRDAASTADYHLLVTQKALDVLRAVPGTEVHAFPVPASPDHWVLFPARQLRPPADARLYTPVEPAEPGEGFQVRGRACAGCGRHRQVTLRPEWLEVPADVVLAGAMVEVGWPGVAVTWIGSEAIANAIRRTGLTGWTLRSIGSGMTQ